MARTSIHLKEVGRPFAPVLVLATLTSWSLSSSGCSSSSPDEVSLVEAFPEAGKDFGAGRYPDFVDDPSALGAVEIGGREMESLTPPFPSTTRFELLVPEAGFLEFSPALIMAQRVRRARVEYRITLEGDEPTTLFRETLRANMPEPQRK